MFNYERSFGEFNSAGGFSNFYILVILLSFQQRRVLPTFRTVLILNWNLSIEFLESLFRESSTMEKYY